MLWCSSVVFVVVTVIILSAVVCVVCVMCHAWKVKKEVGGNLFFNFSEFPPTSLEVPSSSLSSLQSSLEVPSPSTSSSIHLPSLKYTLTNFNVCWHEKIESRASRTYYLSRLRSTWNYFIANQFSLKKVGETSSNRRFHPPFSGLRTGAYCLPGVLFTATGSMRFFCCNRGIRDFLVSLCGKVWKRYLQSTVEFSCESPL